MIIPFNMYNYFSDADQELSKHIRKHPEDLATLFRYGLNYNISARVISADVYSILTDTTLASQDDLQMIYANVHYVYEKPMDAFSKDSTENRKITQPDLFGNGAQTDDSYKKNRDAGMFFSKVMEEETNAHKYLNAVVTNPAIFTALQQRYDTGLFLFINQFELITNYNHCLDRSANYFERKVIVHYTIYNAKGKQLKGGAVTVNFSTEETNVDAIIGKNFPVIADFLNSQLHASINPPSEKSK